MKNRKAQGVNNFFIILIVGGLIAIVGVLIFSKVNSTTIGMFDNTRVHVINETLGTINIQTENNPNSTLISQKGFITNTERIINNSGQGKQLVRNQDYTIAFIGGSSGELDVRANVTLRNNTASGWNNSALSIFYDRNTKSDARASSETMQTTILDSFELGVTAFIVLAAAIILGAVFLFARNR